MGPFGAGGDNRAVGPSNGISGELRDFLFLSLLASMYVTRSEANASRSKVNSMGRNKVLTTNTHGIISLG